MKDNLKKYEDNTPTSELAKRKLWIIIYYLLFRPFGFNFFNGWRVNLLRIMGAKIGYGSIIYSSVYIPAPWNLMVGKFSCLGPGVQLHVGKTFIGNKVTVSQRSYLCSGSHEVTSLDKPFFAKDIHLEDFSWVAAEAFIGPGVTVHEGAVVGARAVVFKDVESWSVVVGNPAKKIKSRGIK